ncbi:hypothetical protein Tco_1337854 [Tanacetum coccineum]
MWHGLEVEQDDLEMEFDAEQVHFWTRWTLVIFDWSNKADDTPSVLALMVTYSEVKLEKWTNASVLQNEVLNKQRYLSDKSCIGFGVESSNGMESENSSGNTNSTESLYPNFQKTKGFHSVPPPTGTLTKGGLLSHQQYLQGKVKSTLPDQIMTRTVPSRSTANVFYLDTARPRVPHAVLSQSTGRPYYPMMDNIRPRYFTFQDSFKLDHSMFGMVERVNRTGLLARRLKKNSPENPIIELLHMDLFGPVLGTKKGSRLSSCNFLENQENQKGKGPDWMFDLELLTPSMNYIPVRKENYADSGGKVSTYEEVEDLDNQQFVVHIPSIAAVQDKHSEEYTADKEVPLSSEEQALHDELVSLMHQESIAKVHNDAQRNAFEKEKRRIALEKDSDDDVPKDGVFSTNSFDDENTDTEEVEGVDDNEVFAPVLELKQSGIFLAFALSWALLVSDGCQKLHFYMATSQYDCTSAASGFEDTTSHPNKVYRVVKAYYGLHQSPKAWSYDWMSMYFLNLQTSHNVCCLSVCTVSSHSKGSHIHAVNRIFRSTSGGCQYLGMKMVYWQCKKTTIVAISSTEANLCSRLKVCCAQIRHHFIRDCYEQRLINVVKVHTDDNVADLLTKGFDLARFNFLVVTIALWLCLRGGYD